MDDAVVRLARQLLETGFVNLTDREQRVIELIAKRARIVVRNANDAQAENQTLGNRIADRVARFGGSWSFIIGFVAALIAWVVVNTVILAGHGGGFDPYPYIFLNLILSMVAALQAPVILMSQNRQAERDRIAAGLDYEINLKAEVEIMALHGKLDDIRIRHLDSVLQEQSEQLRRLLSHAERAQSSQSADP